MENPGKPSRAGLQSKPCDGGSGIEVRMRYDEGDRRKKSVSLLREARRERMAHRFWYFARRTTWASRFISSRLLSQEEGEPCDNRHLLRAGASCQAGILFLWRRWLETSSGCRCDGVFPLAPNSFSCSGFAIVVLSRFASDHWSENSVSF